MPCFVISLLCEAARQVRIVAILTEFPFRISEQLACLAERDRSVALHLCAFGLGQQSPRVGQVLRLDRDQLGIPVKGCRLDILALCILQVATLDFAYSIAE